MNSTEQVANKFQPKYTIDFTNGANKLIKDPSQIDIQDRLVVNNYNIDITKKEAKEEKVLFTEKQRLYLEDLFTSNCQEFSEMIVDDTDEEMTVETLTNMCQSLFNTKKLKTQYTKIHFKEIKKEEDSYYIDSSYNWEIDNYLNLYHTDSGLYLLFHKTKFHNNVFEAHLLYSDSIYKNVVIEEKEDQFIFSKYLKEEILSNDDFEKYIPLLLEQIIPEEYNEIYKLFKKSHIIYQTMEIKFIKEYHIQSELIDNYKQLLHKSESRVKEAEKIQEELIEKYSAHVENTYNTQKELSSTIIKHQENLLAKIQEQDSQRLSDLNKEKNTLMDNMIERDHKLASISEELKVEKVAHTELKLGHKELLGNNILLQEELEVEKSKNRKIISNHKLLNKNYINLDSQVSELQVRVQELLTQLLHEKMEKQDMSKKIQTAEEEQYYLCALM